MQPHPIRPEILYTKKFKKKFLECLSRRPIHLKMIVPYIGKVEPWKDFVDFARSVISKECKLLVVTRPPKSTETGILTEENATELAKQGADLFFRTDPTLHSKIYQFLFHQGDRAAFIGSANFTAGGFVKNDETVAFFRGKEDNNEVEKEIRRLTKNGIEFRHWRVQERWR